MVMVDTPVLFARLMVHNDESGSEPDLTHLLIAASLRPIRRANLRFTQPASFSPVTRPLSNSNSFSY
ncbi:hypothetical protein TNCV_583331 [Trichonephila clavipes]|nr:hypothetical protein TNCV_583331 [Trichonephila clavipes]